MKHRFLTAVTLSMVPAVCIAEGESRELGAHEHGSGTLLIAIEGNRVAMELEAPGADIVGFEYAASTEEDRATVQTAIADLAGPLELFALPAAAGCTVTAANVALIDEEDHHDHDGHGHDDHAEAEGKHDEHGHDEHADAEGGHDEHDHEAAEAEAEHTEFHVEYMFDCASPEAIETIEFAYFERFPNALELDVQLISDAGARSFEVERDDPVLDMRGMF